jgi:hypothetical protein
MTAGAALMRRRSPTNELKGDLGVVVAVVGSCLIAAGILAGVFARRRMRRRTGST